MARTSDHFRQSDVTFWGMVALVTAGVAVLGSNISALAPYSVINALHTPRIGSTSLEAMRQQVSDLQSDVARLTRDYAILGARNDMQEKSGTDTARRVGALEITLPRIVEQLPQTSIDRSNLTASVGASTTTIAEDNTASVRQSPLPGLPTVTATEPQPLPAPIEAGAAAAPPNIIPYGVTIGGFVAETQARAVWNDLQIKIGPLLLEFSPLISAPSNEGSRILIGPMETLAQAREMCERLERIAFSCLPVSYEGREFL